MYASFRSPIVRLTSRQLLPRSSVSILPTRTYASAVSNRVILPKPKYIKEQTEYKQLPDDSMYIEKFYDELDLFKKEIESNETIAGTTFTDFEKDPNELLHQLEMFIEGKVKAKYPKGVLKGVIRTDRFDEFFKNVKLTLRLNGGHPMIFDILLQSKAHFDGFDPKKKKAS